MSLTYHSYTRKPVTSADDDYTPLIMSIEKWKGKVLHGRYPHELSCENVDIPSSNYWLTHGGLKGLCVQYRIRLCPLETILSVL
ncbi:hypothetical protein ILUMI_02489 [Ignelater luminosus]|uniref:Uncharacterized protein n=1 Tax=Ignelater luminosus TaxID=2038154 RepID=A0A8K0DGE7_IGNLU|nr:hypothetical protein ILUMI_02489 [Ignelater luminosus]